MSGPGFRTDLFTEPQGYEEGPLCDRKAAIPDLRQVVQKAEFVRDVIALANSARIFGKPAYLLWGITDRDAQVCGVESSLKAYDRASEPSHLLWENLKHQMGQAIHDYITPLLPHDIRHGIVNGTEVAYLQIPQVGCLRPFQVSREIKGLTTVGQCWIRFGESKRQIQPVEISPDQIPYAYSYAVVPFLIPEHWKAFFQQTLVEQAIAGAYRIEAYQELVTTASKPLQAVVGEFLEGTLQTLIITGTAGSGKSAFVQRLVREWSQYSLAAMEEAIHREDFTAPSSWIPIYFSLRGREIGDYKTLATELLNHMNKIGHFWQERPLEPERLLEHPQLRWLVCFDGLDEIWQPEWQNRFMNALRSLLDRFLHVKAIVTSRKTLTGLQWEGWQTAMVEIAPLSRTRIADYVANFVSGEQYHEIMRTLEATTDLWILCSIPAYLETAIRELAGVYPMPLEDVSPHPEETMPVSVEPIAPLEQQQVVLPTPIDEKELMLPEPITDAMSVAGDEQETSEQTASPIRLGVLLDKVYQNLWEREVNRRLLPTGYTDEWWRATGRLAITVDGRGQNIFGRDLEHTLGGESCLLWIVHLGILEHVARETWRFYTELTKEYFAASFVMPLVESGCYCEAQPFFSATTENFRQRLRSLLSELTTVDTSSLFEGGTNEHSTNP